MEENTPQAGQPGVSKRPVLLTVLCILTFIGSGMNLFSSLTTALAFDTIMPLLMEVAEKLKLPGVEILAMTTPGYLAGNALLYAGSVTGAVLIMKLRKTGFHIYTISQVLLLIFPMYFYKLPSPGIPDLLFTGIFVTLYGSQLRIMK